MKIKLILSTISISAPVPNFIKIYSLCLYEYNFYNLLFCLVHWNFQGKVWHILPRATFPTDNPSTDLVLGITTLNSHLNHDSIEYLYYELQQFCTDSC